MNSLRARLEAFQRSRLGLFVQKIMDDRAPNLASLLAWGTLSTILPLLLGMLSIAGLVLRDPERLAQVSDMVLTALPSDAAGPIREALDGVRSSAGAAGLVGLVLLLFNGSAFFANMGSVFDQAYHVESRNFVMQRVVSVVMLISATVLLVVSTFALGLGSLIDTLPLALPGGPLLGRVISWSISILSALLLFLLIYKLLPNANQGWRDVIPGAALSVVLFFVILQVFPIYLALFPPNQAYALFGVFLVLTFWLYLLGFVFVLGAEVNAFLQEPSRSVALAEATRKAERGQAAFDERTGQVQAESTGDAPQMRGGVLGGPQRSPAAQMREAGNPVQSGSTRDSAGQSTRPSLTGRLLGLVGLMAAAVMLRQQKSPSDRKTTA